MKKLLSLLAAAGLVSGSALTVVSCNSNNDYVNDGEGEGEGEGGGSTPKPPTSNQNVQGYKNLLEKVWLDTYEDELSQSKITNTIDKEGNGDYDGTQIFNFKYLMNNHAIPEGQREIKVDLLEDQAALNKMKNDLAIIFHEHTFTKYFKEMIKLNYDKYKDITMGTDWNNTYGGFEIKDKFELTGQRILPDNGNDEEIIYTLSITPVLKMFYRDESGKTDTHTTAPFEIHLLIGEDGNVMGVINEIKQEMPNHFLHNGAENGSTALNFLDLKKTSPDLKNYGKLTRPIANFVNQKNGTFQKNLNETINSIIKDKIPNATGEIDARQTINEEDVMITKDWLNTDNGWDQLKILSDFQNNSLVNNLILKNKNEPGMNGAIAANLIETRMFSNGKIESRSYDNELERFLKKYDTPDYLLYNFIQQVHAFGTMRLSNIKIVFGGANNDLKLKIPTIIAPWTYANNESKTCTNKKDQLLSALYHSIIYVNEYLWSVNKGHQMETAFLSIDQAAKTDYIKAYAKATKTPWDVIKKKLATGAEIVLEPGTYFEVGTGTNGHEDLIGSQIDEVMKDASDMKFEAFTSSVKIDTPNKLVLKKTTSGKIGVAFKSVINVYQKTMMDYKLTFGNIKIQAKLPWYDPYAPGLKDQLTGAIWESNNSDFYPPHDGHDKEGWYFSKNHIDKNWLLFELDKI
ncbi:lipoprotein [Williamsoniiplasma lucivorax]|uniref:Lipoprotein n=1 Tax=Williamsoniiplasma lucivorax TaxID=209274 RepID=A0A2S5REH6_9MOLU|nr:lipoprotein [Williamsoniiplasma lucivorax]PPE05723.1 hypothetical protein ELUCI_v1c00090 [Williamsoniiplasma lucivorax]